MRHLSAVLLLTFALLIIGCASMGIEYSYPPKPGQPAEEYAADKAECEARRGGGPTTAGKALQAVAWALNPITAAAGSSGAAFGCMEKKGYAYIPRHAWE